jgi:hypothetical protein
MLKFMGHPELAPIWLFLAIMQETGLEGAQTQITSGEV